MKNYLMFALLLGATVGAGFGQSFACPEDECHVAPYFMGSGGFVGMAAEGVDEVTFGVSCGGVVTSGEATPNNGLVAVYLGGGNGLACTAADGGKFEVRGLQDGGWYWITDAMNSAVASLVAKDALGNTAVMPTDPGSSDITLTKMEGGSSTLVKQASTGRIGILHHVLPEPVMEVEEMPHCMPMKSGTKWVSKETGCLLGDGKTKIAMTATVASGAHAGAVYTLSSDTVERPGTGTLKIGLGLWGNGTGRISTSTVSEEITQGWDALPGLATTKAFDADFKAMPLRVGGEKVAATTTLSSLGLAMTETETDMFGPDKIVDGARGDSTKEKDDALIAERMKKNAVDNDAENRAGTLNDPRFDRNPTDRNTTDKAAIQNAFGQLVVNGKATGPITYCKQKPSYRSTTEDTSNYGRFSDRDLGDWILEFVAEDDSVVLVSMEKIKEQSDTETAKLSTEYWESHQGFVRYWNSLTGTTKIKTYRKWIKNLTKTAIQTVEIPVVVCDTTKGDKIKISTELAISPSPDHCSTSTNKSVELELYAPLADTRKRNMNVRPVIAANGKVGSTNVAAKEMLTITCPATSANRGQELLPDNAWSPSRR